MARKDGPLLSSVKTCKGFSLSRKEIERTSKGVKRAINCQIANSVSNVSKNLSAQRRNEPELKGTRLRTELLWLLDTLRNCWVIRFQNRPRKDSNFEIFHTFDMHCKNTTSLTVNDSITRHVIAGSEIAKFRIHQMLYNANSAN